MAIDNLRGVSKRGDRLVFGVQPPEFAALGEPIPSFEVHSTPGLTTEIQLIVIGGAEIGGTTTVKLTPSERGPSVAVFDDIVLSPGAGRPAALVWACLVRLR